MLKLKLDTIKNRNNKNNISYSCKKDSTKKDKFLEEDLKLSNHPIFFRSF
jgi:hypothetical protein